MESTMDIIKHTHQFLEDLKLPVDVKSGQCYSPCPQCSSKRKKKNAKCLSVRKTPNDVTFRCYHCGWLGETRRKTLSISVGGA